MQVSFNIVQDWVLKAKKDVEPIFCNIGAIISDVEVANNTTSYSQSIVLFGSYSVQGALEIMKGVPAFCKIGLFYDSERKESDYEVLIYSYIENLLINHRTPNIAKFLISFSCPRFFERYLPIPNPQGGYYSKINLISSRFGELYGDTFLYFIEKNGGDANKYEMDNVILEDSEINREMECVNEVDASLMKKIGEMKERGIKGKKLEKLKKLRNEAMEMSDEIFNKKIQEYNKLIASFVDVEPAINNLNARILVTEKINGEEMQELNISDEVYDMIVDVIFQVCYTIREFRLCGIRHNDMHLKNVFLSQTPGYLTYFVEKEKFYISDSGKLAKIIDFDHATFTDPGHENPGIEEWCEDHGQCSFPSERNDIYTFISHILEKAKETTRKHETSFEELAAFLGQIVDPRLLELEKGDSIEIEDTRYYSPWYNRACVAGSKPEKCSKTVDLKHVKTFDEMLAAGIFMTYNGDFNHHRKEMHRDFDPTRVYFSAATGMNYAPQRE